MLAIRLQRTGRSGHAQYRMIVQDAHRSPTSGRVVAYLGNYDPHAKTVNLKKDQAQFYLDHGAQPSDRVARLLKSEGVKLPKWVSLNEPKERTIRNPEKLRKNRPAEEVKPAEETVPTETESVEKPASETARSEQPKTETSESPAEESSEEPKEATEDVKPETTENK